MKCIQCFPIQQRLVLSFLIGTIIMAKYASEATYGVTIVAMVDVIDSSLNSTNYSSEIIRGPGQTPVYNWSREMQGYILSAYYWGSLPLQIFSGTIAQRYGAKWVVGVGTIGRAVFDLLKPLSAQGGPYAMMIVCLIQGLVSSAIWPGLFAMYGRWIPSQEISRHAAVGDIGATVGAFLGFIMSGPVSASQALGGWPTVFYLDGAVSLMVVFIWWLLVSNSPEDNPYISYDELHYIQESLKSRQREVNQTVIPWKRILLSRATVTMIAASFGFGWMTRIPSTILPQYLSDVYHLSIIHNSILLSLSTLIMPVVSIAGSQVFDFIICREWVQKTFLRKLYAAAGSAIIGSIFLCFALARLSLWTIMILLLLGYGALRLASLTYYSMPLDLSPEYSGTLSGIFGVCRILSSVILPIVGDNMTKHRTESEWNAVFFLTCALLGASCLFFIVFGTAERQYQWIEISESEDSNPSKAKEDQPLVSKSTADGN